MELETINKLFLELSQFATAKTARELELEERCLNHDKATVLRVLMYDHEQGWGEVSSGLTQDFETGENSFNLRFKDGSEWCVTFKVREIEGEATE